MMVVILNVIRYPVSRTYTSGGGISSKKCSFTWGELKTVIITTMTAATITVLKKHNT